MEVKWVSLLGAPLGVVLLSLLGAGLGRLLGWGAMCGLVVGMIISVASTMVLSRLLIDDGQLQSTHGKIMIGITLVEDLVVVVLIILMPVLVSLTPHHLFGVGLALGKAALILVPIGFLAVYLVPRWLRQVARSQNQELFLLVILAICLGTAALTEAVGLSLALGAFAAGLIISSSDYAHRALDQMMTLRDAFVALFFVTVGILINPRAVLSRPVAAGNSGTGDGGQVCRLDGGGKAVWVSAEDGGAGWDGADADWGVLVCAGAGGARQWAGRGRVLLCDPGDVADVDFAECFAGAHGAEVDGAHRMITERILPSFGP